eukprot:1986818-Amphidinium_carterae.1
MLEPPSIPEKASVCLLATLSLFVMTFISLRPVHCNTNCYAYVLYNRKGLLNKSPRAPPPRQFRTSGKRKRCSEVVQLYGAQQLR